MFSGQRRGRTEVDLVGAIGQQFFLQDGSFLRDQTDKVVVEENVLFRFIQTEDGTYRISVLLLFLFLLVPFLSEVVLGSPTKLGTGSR